jgi:hypothetical protein
LIFNKQNNLRRDYNGKQNIEIFILAVLMFQFIVLCPGIEHLNPFAVTPYFLSYQDFGFNSRLFVGSIFKLFSEYISSSTIYYSIIVIIIFMNALVALTLGAAFRRSSIETSGSFQVFMILFLSSPFSLSFLFHGENFGRFDTYLIIITVIMMLIVRRKYLRWLIPILCFAAVAIYQGYVMLYMPVIAIILVYECYKNRFKLSSLFLCGSSFSIIIALSIYFQYSTPGFDFKNAQAVVDYLAHRTDFKLSEIMIFTEYFINVVDSFPYQIQIVKSFAVPYTVIVIAMTSPLIAVFGSLWSVAFKTAQDRFLKFIIFLCMAAPLMSLPIFIGNDWDRWISAVFITQFSLAFYFMYSGFECITISAAKISGYFTMHRALFLFICLFLAALLFSVSRFLFMLLQQSAAEIYYDMLEKARSQLN